MGGNWWELTPEQMDDVEKYNDELREKWKKEHEGDGEDSGEGESTGEGESSGEGENAEGTLEEKPERQIERTRSDDDWVR